MVIFFPSKEKNSTITRKKLLIKVNKHCIKLGIILSWTALSLRWWIQAIRWLEAECCRKVRDTITDPMLWIFRRKSAFEARIGSVWGINNVCLFGIISLILHFLSCHSIYHSYSRRITPEALLPANTPRMFFYEKSLKIIGEYTGERFLFAIWPY